MILSIRNTSLFDIEISLLQEAKQLRNFSYEPLFRRDQKSLMVLWITHLANVIYNSGIEDCCH